MERWTEQQVVALAPDDRSVAAARKLARPGPWSDLGSTDTLVWGKCQGSGSTPYQVSVDLTGPAARCTCPSRKFPCKHGLALLLLWVQGDGTVAHAEDAADFAGEWAASRRDRAAAGADRAERRAARGGRPADPAAQARRIEERVALMSAGLDDFARWLGDLARNGLAAARSQPYAFWDDAASRLVDAQVPGLAERVREMASSVVARDDWADHLLAEVGRWWCATRAWRHREALTPPGLGDLRAYLGWSVPTDDVRAGDAVADRWVVLGVHRTDDGRLQQQRTWLHGLTSGETVVVLDFAAVGGALGVAKVVGSVLEATVARYPGRGIRRALFADEAQVAAMATDLPPGARWGESVDDALAVAAEALAANPWFDRTPVLLRSVAVVPAAPVDGSEAGARPRVAGALDGPLVVDAADRCLPMVPGSSPWPILARTGGRPVDVFAEVEGGRLRPLTVAVAGELVAV